MNDARNGLRKLAEEKLAEGKKSSEDMFGKDPAELVQELRIHQVELEMQNEELRKSQEETEKARKTYVDLWEFSPVGYVIIDSVGRITAANRSAQGLFGRSENAVLNERFTAFLSDGDQVGVHLLLETMTIGKISAPREAGLVRPDGSFCTCRLFCGAFEGDSGERKIQVALTDISEQKQAESKIKESEERFRMMADSSPTIIWMTDDQGRTRFVNKTYLEFVGADLEQVKDFGREAFIHPEDFEDYGNSFFKSLKERRSFCAEVRVRRADGEWRWLESHANPRFSPSGKFFGMIGGSPDITDHKQAISDLQKAHAALQAIRENLERRVRARTSALEKKSIEQQRINRLLREEVERRKQYESELKEKGEQLLEEIGRRAFLSRKLVTLLERERKEISSTLHDEIGQILTTVQMDLDAIKKVRREDQEIVGSEIEHAQRTICRAMTLIRDLSRQLRPDILTHLGLIPAIENLMEMVEERSDIIPHLFTKGVSKNMGKTKGLTVYRIIQESLTNVLRYSGAKNVFVSVIQNGGVLRVSVEDDGVGFRMSESSTRDKNLATLGIVIMQERAVQAGGELRVESQPGKGTHVMADIPVEDA